MKFTSIGFAVDDLSSSQTSFMLIKNTNEAMSQDHSLNVNVFFQDNFSPCVEPKFARFNLKDAFVFQGDLIATSIKTAISIRSFLRPYKYFYIQDLEYLRKNANENEWNKVMEDDSIVKFARSEDHKQILMDKGFKIHQKIVKDFNIKDVLEIINDNKTIKK